MSRKKIISAPRYFRMILNKKRGKRKAKILYYFLRMPINPPSIIMKDMITPATGIPVFCIGIVCAFTFDFADGSPDPRIVTKV
ncbi:hypothetical protein [Methanobacterium congolense]|uniref:Region of a membrane-bound protein predicted to be embedded in the membrane n=1 Tax=Methanobacterium congolense TaxID=118062 RepID=A0A1D3L1P0_9EURY|nr:hypothetical protein [Methanobacterium congolense]SCG85594.1 Region of a membrane-bound protein predicted to be embedded in the membrane [Methanobacterium congolense]